MGEIVVYRAVASDGGVGFVTPGDVENPVHNQSWHDPDDDTHAGVRETRPVLDAAALLARAQSIHARYPINDPATGEPYTDEALEQAVTDWITEAGA